MRQESPAFVVAEPVEGRVTRVDADADAARYRALFRSIKQGFCVVEVLFDADGRAVDLEYIEANPAFVLHSPFRDVVGRRLRELQPDLEASWFEMYEEVATSGQPQSFTMKSDVLGRVFEVEAFPIDEQRRNRLGILFSDVTEKARRAEQSQASRRMFEEVLRKMPALVCVISSRDLRIELVNAAYQALAPDVVMVGRTLDDLWSDTGKDFSAICRRVLETGEHYVATDDPNLIRRSPGGPLERAYFDWSIHRIRLQDGDNEWGLLNFAWETTARHEAEAALRAGELRYRQLFEQIPDGIFLANDEGRYIDVNPAGCALLGMSHEELLASTFLDVLVPEEHHRIEDAVRLMDDGGVTRSDWRFRRKDGSVFIGELTGRRTADGVLQGVLRDVSDAKRAEAARRESEARFRVMADDLPLIVWVHEAGGELEYVNKTFCEYFGVTHEEAKGDRWRLLTHPDDGDAYVEGFLQCSAQRRRFHGQARVRRADGEWRWIESWARPRWAGDEFLGMVGTSADITTRKEAARALQEADRRKDEFLALLAHELRNPLAPLRNGLELLALSKDSPEVAERAREMMQRQVAYMVRLIDDLLDVSRIARGKLELRTEARDLRDIINSAVETSTPVLQAGRHQFVCSISAGSYPVTADPVRLAQVFANLLNNAARYTPPGGQVRLTAHAEDGQAVVAVSDNGVGIPRSMLEQVFEPFRQIESRDRPSHGGLGLGLSLARSLVELHNGSVVADSAGEGQGSTFTVRLPLVAERDARDFGGEETPPNEERSRRVLVVDDNRDAADSLAAVLRALGHELQTAYDGPAALETAKVFRPDIVLLDIGMPNMNGYEVARRLQAADLKRQPVLVALTGYGQEADRERSRAAGIRHHFVKPVDLKELQRVLTETAGARSAMDGGKAR